MSLRALRSLLFGIACTAPVALTAQTFVWTGATDGNWATAANWDAGVPTGGTTTVISFDASANPTTVNNIGGGLTLNQLTFGANAGAVTISGNALTFDGTAPTLVNHATDPGDVRIAVPVVLNQTLTVTGGPDVNAQLIFVTGSGLSGAGGLTWAGGIGFNNTASSYTGQTQILGGVLGTNVSSGLGANASATVASGGSLQLQGGATINKALSLAGAGFTGHSALEASTGGGAWSGLVTLASSATVGAFSNSALTLSGGVALGANTLTAFADGDSTVVLSGAVTGTGGVTKTGAGTVIFSGSASTYSGPTLIAAGSGLVTTANGLGTSAVTVSSGATLTVAGVAIARTLSLAGTLGANSTSTSTWSGPITLGGNATLTATGATTLNSTLNITGGLALNGSTLTVAPDSGARNIVRLSSAITGTGALNITTTGGTVALVGGGANTFTGPVSVSGGVMLGLGDNFGNLANTVTFASGSVVTFENNATIGARPWVISSTGGLTLVPSGLGHAIGANISGDGALAVTSIGLGTGGLVTLSGANTFTGGLTVGPSSTVITSTDAALGAAGGAITLSGGGLTFGADFTLPVARTVMIDSANGTISAPAGTTATIAASLTGAGRLTLGGGSGGNIGGTIILAGTNTQAGGVLLNGATLALDSDARLGGPTGVFNLTGNSALLATGSFTVAATRSTTFSNLVIDTNGFNVTFAQSLTGTGIEKNGAGVLRFDAANASTSTNNVLLNAGTLRAGVVNAYGTGAVITTTTGTTFDLNGFNQSLSGVSGDGAIALGGGTLTMRGSTLFSGAISGTGGVILENSGSFIFSGANTFTGGLTVRTEASLDVASTAALGAISGSITVDNGRLSASSFATGPVEIDAALPLTIGAGGAGFGSSGQSLIISRALAGTVPISITGGGDGYEVRLANASNTFVSNLQIGTQGSGAVLGLVANGSLGAAANTVTLGDHFFDGETHRTATGTLRAFADLTLPATRVVQLNGQGSSGGGILDTNGFTFTVDGPITQLATGIGLEKKGAGTLVLNGASTFTGTLRVSEGTLGGTGSLAGGLLVQSATLAPGSGAGLFTVAGNLTLSGGSLTLLELGGSDRGTGYDALNIGGTLAADGTLSLSLTNGYSPASGSSFLLFSAGSYSGSFAAVNLPALAGGLTWNDAQLATAGLLTVTGSAIPEPSTYALMAGCAGLLAAWWKRKRNRVVPAFEQNRTK